MNGASDGGTADPAAPPVAPPPGDGPEDASHDAAKAERRRLQKEGDEQARRAERRARRERTNRRRMKVFRGVLAVVRRLPLPVACVLGEILGRALYYLIPWLRRQTLANLATAFGDEKSPTERRRIARRCYGLVGRAALAYPVLHRLGLQEILRRVDLVVTPDAREALDAKSGGIGLSQHFGLFELAAIVASPRWPALGIGRDVRGDDPLEIIIGMRGDLGVETIARGNARELVRRLRDGWVAGMFVDQDVRDVNGVFVPFFGRPTCTPPGPVALALRLKIPLFVVTTEWTSLTRHRVTIGPIVAPRDDLPPADREIELLARYIEASEQIIRRRPDHWLWMHERWRTRPEDAPGAPRWPRVPAETEPARG